MVELDGRVEVTGVDGPVPFVDLFQGRDELVVYKHMWYDGAPYQGQCEGCTTTAWHVKDAVYLNARGVSFGVLTSGPWDEVAPYVEFMGYTQPWYSVRGGEAPVGGGNGANRLFPAGRRPRVAHLLHDRPGQRAAQWVPRPAGHDALRPPRGVGGQPRGLARGPSGDSPVGGHGSPICWYWRSDARGVATWGPTSRPVPQWTRPGATPVETLGRQGHHH